MGLYDSELIKNDYVIYMDTDSVVGSSIIRTDKGDFTIEELWNKAFDIREYSNGKFIGKLDNYRSFSFNTENCLLVLSKIVYIMKHKVNKRLFKIKCDYSNEVIVTEDHSIIVKNITKKNEGFKSIPPIMIEENDSIIRKIGIALSFEDRFTIEDLGIQEVDVYDLEIEETHNFFANDILVHNSCFIDLFEFVKNNGLEEQWNKLSEEKKVEFCKRISDQACEYINENSFLKTQKRDFNSNENEYKISFKQEIVAKSGLFVAKKKYCLYLIDNEGVKPTDPLQVSGLEVIRSDTPLAVKEPLKKIMISILDDISDEDLKALISKFEDELKAVAPEEIASNVGISEFDKYMSEEGEAKKGTPRHVKGALALKNIINQLDLQDKVEEIQEGEKVKVVYLKNNRWNIESFAFQKWVKEFNDAGLEIDYNKMIEKNFRAKILMFLTPMKKEYILDKTNEVFNDFFA